MNTFDFESALNVLGQYFLDNQLKYEIVVIGGGALLLLGHIIRPTKDLDVVALMSGNELISAQPLPDSLVKAVAKVAMALKLPKNWINSAPGDLWKMGLPDGFRERLQPVCYGGLLIYFASRFDQICFKLYASVDQGPESKHFDDLKRLNPTHEELEKAAAWCKTQDVSDDFAQFLKEALRQLGESNG